MLPQPTPTSLKADAGALLIQWSDGITHRIAWRTLRDRCPCATCRTEKERPPQPATLLAVLSPAEAQPLRPLAVRPVGNYAYSIQFSDGHASGIYSLEYLRELGDAAAK